MRRTSKKQKRQAAMDRQRTGMDASPLSSFERGMIDIGLVVFGVVVLACIISWFVGHMTAQNVAITAGVTAFVLLYLMVCIEGYRAKRTRKARRTRSTVCP